MRNKKEHLGRAKVLLLAVASLIIGTTSFFTSSGLAYAQAAAPSWSFTGSLNTPRSGYTATLLPNGKVLVTGGQSADGILASSELYDPSTGTWSPTGNPNAPRIYHSATLLQNGKVLVAGGWANNCCGELSDTAELYDPATGRWSLTGNLNARRVGHTATLLSNGTVLFAGGGLVASSAFSTTSTAELYNPGTGTWSFTGSLNESRVVHAATLLQDGKVLVVGGCGDGECFFELGSAELYDPTTGAWSPTGSLNTERYDVSATTLPNGNVLVAGGSGDSGALSSAELYSPATGLWSYTGSLLSHRQGATATLLPSGQVLVAAGVIWYYHDGEVPDVLKSAELYDPASANWRATASLNTERFGHTATLLLNGKVLVVGGYRKPDNNPLHSAELYDSGGSSTINPIDDPQFFVRQHYLDFLNREPDQGGWDYWTDRITQCGSDVRCIHERRIGVSAAFFIELEFQDTGYYVYRFYRASFGRQPNYAEFTSDRSRVVDGSEANKQAFADEWAQRTAFTQAYPNTMGNTEFVNKLFDTAGLTASIYDPQRQQAISAMNSGRSRSLVLRDVIEIPDFKSTPDPNSSRYAEVKQVSQYNPAFVLMQYFGYLRRDVDQDGYDHWLDVLNNRAPNNYHAMVCAFLTSEEYQLRFGASVTRTNQDCGP